MGQRLVVLGASAFVEEAADMIEDAGGFELVRVGVAEEEIAGLARLAGDHLAVCAETLTPLRRRLARAAEESGFGFATVVHPLAQVAPSARVGEGSLVWPRVVAAAGAQVGEHAVLNRGALVGARTELSGYVTLSPGANVGAGVRLGRGVLVGMGAVVLDGCSVGTGSVVGSGSLVAADVPERVQVLGTPATVRKRG